MKKSDLTSYFCFLIVATAGAALGFYHNQTLGNHSSDLSSTANPSASLNDYKTLPCPSDAKYKELQERIHLTLPNGTKGCSTDITAGLGKILLLMEKTELQTPKDWLPKIQEELTHPLEYLAKQVDNMHFDLSETDALATNMGDRSIVLGGGLLMNDPFNSMSTLIHEARHSDKSAVIHVECIAGDLPRTRGGCDAKFDVGPHAGAYAYDVIFQSALAFFGKDLIAADREYLMSSALAILGTRFNELPASLATHADMLVTLNKENKLQLLHPFTNDLLHIDLPFKDRKEFVENIDFSVRDSGVLLFTNKKRLLSWTPRRGMGPLYKNIFHNDIKVSEAARITLPTESGRSRFVAQSTDGRMYWVKFSPEKLDFVLAPYPYLELDKSQINKTVWSQFFLASFGESVFLTADGKVYLGGHNKTGRETFVLREDMQDPSGWVHGTGGISYDNLYLINGRGELKIASVSLQEIDDYHSVTTYSFANVDFQAPSAIKYLQGLQTQVQLTKNGDLYLQDYASKSTQTVEGHGFKDFAFAQVATLDQSIAPSKNEYARFRKICQVKKHITDPWFGQGIGIDSQQRLVFAGNKEHPCLIRKGLPPVIDVTLKADPSNKGMGLEVTTSAGPQWIAPYK
ncbi:hypothetical protein [Bdellovibrio sp. HCB209]|uniref:hypothetical protein n=1 Tax=Bdellovibrio sp. HCB209 TaxID=3394354 RepID=UPI0039B597A9